MIINETLKSEMFAILDGSSIPSRNSVTEEEFERVLNTFQVINGLPKSVKIFNDTNLDEWLIPDLFAGFVVPSHVGVSVSADAMDFRVEEYNTAEVIVNSCFNYDEFYVICKKVYNALRANYASNACSSLSSLRTPKTINDVLARTSYQGMCAVGCDVAMPVELSIPLWKPSEYMIPVKRIVLKSWRDVLERVSK